MVHPTGELCLDVDESNEIEPRGEYRMKIHTDVGNLTFNVCKLAHGLSVARHHPGNIG